MQNKTVLRFAVMADAHFGLANVDCVPERFARAMAAFYKRAENDKDHNSVDALVFVGDFVDTSHEDNYAELIKGLKDNVKAETKVLACLGNHEYYPHRDLMLALKNNELRVMDTSEAAQIMSRHIGAEADTSVDINGYRFILNSLRFDMKNGKYWNDVENLDWLAREVEAASKAHPERPIFTFSHFCFENTIAVNVHNKYFFNAGFGAVYQIYKNYPQMVSFTGHDHYPINFDNAIHQRDITTVAAGHLRIGEISADDGAMSINTSQCLLVEVDASNVVTVKRYDALNDRFLPDWTVIPKRGKFTYTDARAEKYKDMAFAPDALRAVETDGGVMLELKAITANPNVTHYRITASDGENEVARVIIPSNAWELEPPTVFKKEIKLEKNKTYTLRAVVFDSFGNQVTQDVTVKI